MHITLKKIIIKTTLLLSPLINRLFVYANNFQNIFHFHSWNFNSFSQSDCWVEFMNFGGRFYADFISFTREVWNFIATKQKHPDRWCWYWLTQKKNADDDKTTRHDYSLWSKCFLFALLNHLLVRSKCSSSFLLAFYFLFNCLFLFVSLFVIFKCALNKIY